MSLAAKATGFGAIRSVGGVREAIQDLVTPDLKAVKVQVEALTQEMRLRNEQHQKSLDQLAQEMRLRNEALSHEMKLRSESMQENLSREIQLRTANLQDELRMRDSNQATSLRRLEQSHVELNDAVKEVARRIDLMNVDLRERVATLEARLPKQ